MVAREASKAMLCCTSLPPACPELDQALAVACTPCRVGRNEVRLALAVPGHAAMLILHIWGQAHAPGGHGHAKHSALCLLTNHPHAAKQTLQLLPHTTNESDMKSS